MPTEEQYRENLLDLSEGGRSKDGSQSRGMLHTGVNHGKTEFWCAQSLWVADLTSGLWTVNADGTVSPNDLRIVYSLIAADMRGGVHLVSNQQGPPAIAFGKLADIIQAELATQRVDVAGFDQWPWEVAYRRLQEQNDLPEELLPTPPPGYDTGEEP